MTGSPGDTISFWVSATGSATGDGTRANPFDTIEKAQLAVRAVLQAPGTLDKDIVVNIGGGTYQLDQTLSFDARDSGRDGHTVHYRAVPGEHPVISGGRGVTGWTQVAAPGITLAPGTQLWQADVGLGIDSRQLYIDGVRAVRAESNDAQSTYPVGFRPSYQEEPGVSGIKYATDIASNPNNANWADPTDWGTVGDVHDIEAVLYTQWKMISVPLKDVGAADPSTSTGLIELLDPAWTNANLIRNAPMATTTSGSDVITMFDGGAQSSLAKVDTYFGDIKVGMIVTGPGIATDQEVTVTAVDPSTGQVTLSKAATATATTGSPAALTFTDPATMEPVVTDPNIWSLWRVSKFVNAYEFLDQPDEWYLDQTTGKLYLVTHAGDDPNGHDIQLPVLEKLVDGNGASNLAFEGLAFKYATWLDPSRVTATTDPDTHETTYSADGYVADQSAFRIVGEGHEKNLIGHFQDTVRTAGNVSFHDGTNITFEGNTFSHLGGVGLDLSGGAQDNRVVYNIFTDISSSAVVLGGVDADDARPATPADEVSNNQIVGNYVSHAAVEFYDAAGIFVGYSRNATVAQNYITDVSWAGIAVGWGWGMRDIGGFPGVGGPPDQWGVNTTPTIMEGNQVTDNTITRFLQKLWDGGAIYVVGGQDGDIGDGTNGTLLARNYAFDKTPGAGSNIFYTDGGTRFVTVDGNISFGNDQGFTNFGPEFLPNDTLNAGSPTASLPLLNSWAVYGSDIGGCITYGDILYLNNYWQNLWGSLEPSSDPRPGGEILQLFEQLLIYLSVVKNDYADWPNTPLYFDPGVYTDQDGVVYPTRLTFPDGSNKIIDGVSSYNADHLGGFATTANTLAFTTATSTVAARTDALGGHVSFGLLSLADGHTASLLDDAIGRNINALAYGDGTGSAWLGTEGKAQGTIAAATAEIGTGVWLPTATLDDLVPLPITALEIDGNSAFATFWGGYQATFTLGGSRSIANDSVSEHLAVTVSRLAGYQNGLAFYEADRTTGAIVVDGHTVLPGDAGYLQGALANAQSAGLVLDGHDLPAFGQQQTFDNLALTDTRSYGLLLLVNNDYHTLYSSYSEANPGGSTQMIALGNADGHGITYGIEDMLATSVFSDRDYNDLIVRLHPSDSLF
jgi:hypothetical protein